MKVSIIVPVYNVERYLDRCLTSILNQTYKDIEIILVDDGSEDLSLEICKKYAKKDTRVIVISQSNGGVSKARNHGLQIATGKYVTFVDSDDTVEDTLCEELYIKAEKGDWPLVLSGYNQIKIIKGTESVKRYSINPKESINCREQFEKYYDSWFERRFLLSGCAKLFRRDIIIANDIVFDESFFVGEDFLFVHEYLKYTTFRIGIVDQNLYNYYIQSEKHLTGIFSFSRIETVNNMFDRSRQLYSQLQIKKIGLSCMSRYYARTVTIVFQNLDLTAGKSRQKFKSICDQMKKKEILRWLNKKRPEELLYYIIFTYRSIFGLKFCLLMRQCALFLRK